MMWYLAIGRIRPLIVLYYCVYVLSVLHRINVTIQWHLFSVL